MSTAITLAVLLTLVVGSGLAILRVDRRALPNVLAAAVLILAVGAYAAVMISL